MPEPIATTRHPGWCDPRLCLPTDVDVQHRSNPDRYRTLDNDFHTSLAQADEYDGGDGDLEVLLDVDGAVDAQIIFKRRELPGMIELLTRAYYRPEFTSTLVVRRAATS